MRGCLTCLATLRASQYGLESSTALPIFFNSSSSFTVASTRTERNFCRASCSQGIRREHSSGLRKNLEKSA